MQVGDSIQVNVVPGVKLGQLSATPSTLVKFGKDIILAEHSGIAHIYVGRGDACNELFKPPCEVLILRIGNR